MILAGVKLKAALYANERNLASRTISSILNVSEETIQHTLKANNRTHPHALSRLKVQSEEWKEVVAEVIQMSEYETPPGVCAMATGEPYTYESKNGTVYVRADGVSLPFIKGLYEVGK